MGYRVAKTFLLPVLFTFFLFQSGAEAAHYVMLSITKDGLRELRLSFRGRLVLETSLASDQSSDSLVFSRATDGIRVVETVIRYGAIDDCIVSSSSQDVRSFKSEFSELPPGQMADTESDIMDFYLDVNKITDPVFLAKHSINNNESLFNSTFSYTSPGYQENLQGHNFSRISDDYFLNLSDLKLSAKILSAKHSLFVQMMRPYLQIQKNARECKIFYEKAKERLEMLSVLVDEASLDGQRPMGAFLNTTGSSGPRMNRRHRGHNLIRHHRRRSLLLRGNRAVKDSGVGPLGGSLPSSYHDLTLSLHDTQKRGTAHDIPESDRLHDILESGRFHDTRTNGHVNDRRESDRVYNPQEIDNSYLSTSPVPDLENDPITIKHSRIGPAAPSASTSSSSIKSSLTSLSNPKVRIPEDLDNMNPSYRTFNITSSPDVSSLVGGQVNGSSNSLKTNKDDHSSYDVVSTGSLTLGPPETSGGVSRIKRDLFTGWMILPGTKWCGDGDIAEHKKDVGYHVELDKCCRRHDLCPLVIHRLHWKYGMFNYRLHTLSHCRCDRKFRKCLKASTSPLAHLIGQIYFNVVGPQCFKFTQKSTCVQRYWWGGCREWANTKVAFPKKQRSFK